jgi:hypothetical protein
MKITRIAHLGIAVKELDPVKNSTAKILTSTDIMKKWWNLRKLR